MLSYMLPIEDKPPQMPNKTHLQLDLDDDTAPQQQQQLTNGHPKKHPQKPAKYIKTMVHASGNLSKENSANSFDKFAKCGGNISKDSSVNSFASESGCPPALVAPKCLKQYPFHHQYIGSISKDSSVSSFASDATTATASQSSMTPTSTISDKPKNKLLANGATKHTGLKRVSFGSSKGSMVETLIYESPLQEEPENSPTVERTCPFPADGIDQTEAERSKVRVTFYQQSRPLVVSTPPPPLDLLLDDFLLDTDPTAVLNMSTGATVAQQPTSLTTVVTETTHVQYSRQESNESGWDNPFRPGGELSREAEEIVEMIKGGKPITPTPGSVAPGLPSVDEADVATTPATTPASTIDAASPLNQSPDKKTTVNDLNATPKSTTNNGYTANNATAPSSKTKQPASPGAVDVKRDNVGAPADGSQVEHVVLKKKPRCKCCVIQ